MSKESLVVNELGETGLRVTNIGIGGAALGGMPEDFGFDVSENQASDIIHAVFKSSINFLDTAHVYGESEKRIGTVIKELGGIPDSFVLATKVDRDPVTGVMDAGQIEKSVNESLEKLGVNKLQLVYLHDPEYSNLTFSEIIAKGGPVARLLSFKDEKVIEHVGISGGPIQMLLDYLETEMFEVVITHNRYTLLWQVADPLLDQARKCGVGVVNAAPYGSGVLADFEKSNRYAYRNVTKEERKRLTEIIKVCDEYNVPLRVAALQFSVRDPRIDSTIVGVVSPSEIEEAIAALSFKIPDDFWEKVGKSAIRQGDPEKNYILK